MLVSAFLVVPTLNTARTKIDLIKSYFSLLAGTKTRSGEMGRKREREKGGSGVFQVMANQLLSATLWGGTPDSEGKPFCSISTLLHFFSLKPLVLEGAWESILTSGGIAASLPAC